MIINQYHPFVAYSSAVALCLGLRATIVHVLPCSLHDLCFLRCSHLNKTTTYEDPRKDYQDEPPQPRQIDLIRDPEMGFGFVAGSEKPVIVR